MKNTTSVTIGKGVNKVELFISYSLLVGIATYSGVYVTSESPTATTSKHISTWLESRKATRLTQTELEAMITVA